MQNSMENKDFHFHGTGMTKAAGVVEGDIGRDRNFTCERAPTSGTIASGFRSK
jgi:hypothetical protein